MGVSLLSDYIEYIFIGISILQCIIALNWLIVYSHYSRVAPIAKRTPKISVILGIQAILFFTIDRTLLALYYKEDSLGWIIGYTLLHELLTTAAYFVQV